MVKNEKESWIISKVIPPLDYKFCWLVEEYRLELAKKNPYLKLDIDLSWAIICWIHEVVLISKSFWFIQWLVENDKIDLTKLEDNSDWYWIELWDDCYEVLALLSIQDNPIEFLISILK